MREISELWHMVQCTEWHCWCPKWHLFHVILFLWVINILQIRTLVIVVSLCHSGYWRRGWPKVWRQNTCFLPKIVVSPSSYVTDSIKVSSLLHSWSIWDMQLIGVPSGHYMRCFVKWCTIYYLCKPLNSGQISILHLIVVVHKVRVSCWCNEWLLDNQQNILWSQ